MGCLIVVGVLVIVVESMDEVGPNETQELDGPSVPWRPRQLAFGQYRQESEPANKEQTLRVVVRRPRSYKENFLDLELRKLMSCKHFWIKNGKGTLGIDGSIADVRA
ncbi:unnamed protein product [Dovyalis caffra]|uniref:Uncharacterized protein n=1 Tax=Dovyalis caffra TaxID=77055 RepID=A0AAV1RD14_9ROSI|nr:unnamed protein product [Dovyalis caffra]